MASGRYNLRSTPSRVAATRAARELGIPASEARRNVRARPAPRRQQPRRISLVGAWAPENIAQTVREERLRHQTNNYHIIIQTRPYENLDRPQVEVIRHTIPSLPEGQDQHRPYSVQQLAYQRLYSIHDNELGVFVYHYKRDARRNIIATWFGRICVSLYDLDLCGTIWENPGVFNYIQMLKHTSDEDLHLRGVINGRHIYTFDCRTRQYAWKIPRFV
ncbi:hypothetical protein PG996_012818 [Apiospora saccharicola]|uniref:Uncharacterized protein n=1 Tax=Apiospora saccharicola TaxID=335842 RepID=A0ABR1U3P4_9PEZI